MREPRKREPVSLDSVDDIPRKAKTAAQSPRNTVAEASETQTRARTVIRRFRFRRTLKPNALLQDACAFYRKAAHANELVKMQVTVQG